MAFVTDIHICVKYALIALSCGLIAWLFIGKWGRKQRRYWLNYAAMSVPLSLIISLLLTMFDTPDDLNILIGLTVGVLGGFALLVVLNFVLLSVLGTKNTRETFQAINKRYQGKKLSFVRVLLIKDVFMVLTKTAISVAAASFFMFANALYSAGLGIARFIAVKMHAQDKETQIKSYFKVGGVIFLASIAYVIYSIRLFWKSEIPTYDMIVGIAIACYTFFEFGLNIREAWRLRKSHALEAKALRAIGLSSTLLCFVLTQTALMSFANEGDSSFANALAGVVFGGSAALVGVYVMARSRVLILSLFRKRESIKEKTL